MMRGRCALCRCRATTKLYGIKVCGWHVEHGEEDRPCPYCATRRLFDPRWTYTINGSLPPTKVQVRIMNMPNTIFLDNNGEVVLDVIPVKEPSPRGWPTQFRFSAVLIGIGLQMGSTFTITQWGSDWERDLLDAVRPTLALANKVFIVSRFDHDTEVLAGTFRATCEPTWPTLDVREKTDNVRRVLNNQNIQPHERENDINPDRAHRLWNQKDREPVWRHNYLNVLDAAMRIFQVDWTEEES
jgi:hypothetical protein